jgi:YVTN family beta-propeller protein
MKSIAAVLFVTIALAPSLLIAQATPSPALLALSKHDHTLAIVEPATLKVVAKAPVGNDPHEVIASTDGKTAYVSNYGFGAFNTLAVIDLVAQKPLPAIDLGALRGPHGLTFIGGKTWFTVEGSKAIGSYDPATKKVDWILGTGQNRTHMIYVTEDLQRIYTTNVSSGTVSIIEKAAPRSAAGPPPGQATAGAPPRPMAIPGGDWNETVVRVGDGSEGFDATPDGKEIWVANANDGTISIIEMPAKTVSQTLNANVKSANRLKITPDGKLAFVSMLGAGDVAVFEVASRKEVKRIPVGHGAAGIEIQPDASRVYVACTPDNYVAVIDVKSLAVVGHIDVGTEPDGLAWAVRR